MRSRGVSSYRSNKRGKRSSNKLSRRLSKRRIRRSNRRLNRRVSKRMSNNRKSFRGGGNNYTAIYAPQKNPHDPDYKIVCSESKLGEGGKYEYKITLKRKEEEDREIWRRWSHCQHLDTVLKGISNISPKYDRRVKKFPGKWLRARTLDEISARQSQLNIYFNSLAIWLRDIEKRSNGEISLMREPTDHSGRPRDEYQKKLYVYNFFFQDTAPRM